MDTIPQEILQKQCDACLETKPLADFGRNREHHDNKQKCCKACVKKSRYKKAIATPDQTKQCANCLETKPLIAFSSDGGSRNLFGVRNKCKICEEASRKDYYKTHARKKYPQTWNAKQGREDKLRKKFNLTGEQYNEMLASQHGVCALCDRPERYRESRTGDIKHLAVDHCHATGRVRALLCQECNLVIGKIEDNPKILERAADYLNRYK